MRSHSQQRFRFRLAVAAGMLAILGGCSTPSSATRATAQPAPGLVAINYVSHRYIDEVAFQRISEYFTGRENKSGRVIERSDPKQRAGYYFIIDLAWHPSVSIPAGTRAELDYIRNDNPTAHKVEYVFSNDTTTWPEIFLGLTGADWPSKDISIVAYKITLEDAQGKVLAERASFLWSLPETTPAAAVAAEPASPPATATP